MRQRGLPRSRVDIQDFIEKTDDGLAKIFAALRDIAQAGSSGENAAPPTILLAIDQGEELFNEEGRDEARRFIDILTRTLTADPRTMAILVMRSDAFPLVQNEPALAALPKDTFTLDMMLEGSYRAVIEGPARLVEPPLKIDPQLTDALLEDISGQDALPLLAFTLAPPLRQHPGRQRADARRLRQDRPREGRDRQDGRRRPSPRPSPRARCRKTKRSSSRSRARPSFRIWRRSTRPASSCVACAPRDKIPAEARPLIDRFAEQRLLIRDRRQDAEVIEVAHEALLRQPPFSDWLAEDREFLLWRDRLTQARAAFEADERGLFAGRELAIARSYMQTRAERDFEPADLAFIRDSIAADDKRRADEAEEQRRREAAEKEEQERRIRDAERIAEEQTKAAAAQKRATRAVFVGLVVALLVAGAAVWQYFEATKASKAAKEATAKQTREANLREAQITQSLFLADLARQQRRAGDAGNRGPARARGAARSHAAGIDSTVCPRGGVAARRRLARSARAARSQAMRVVCRARRSAPTASASSPRLGTRRRGCGTPRPASRSASRSKAMTDACVSAAFSPDGKRIVTASADKTARLWDAETGKPIGEPLTGHEDACDERGVQPRRQAHRHRVLGQDGAAVGRARPASRSASRSEAMTDGVLSAAFSPDGKRIVTASEDKTARLWDAETGKPIGEPLKGHDGCVCRARRSAPTASASSPRLRTRRRGCGTPRPASRSASRSKAMTDAVCERGVQPRRQAHRHRVSMTRRRGCGTPRPASRSASRSEAMRIGVCSAAFSPDGKRIVTASEDKTARLWDAETGKPIGEPLKGHEDRCVSAAFSPDGKRIVTASEDKTARLWDAETGKPIGEPLKGHDGCGV